MKGQAVTTLIDQGTRGPKPGANSPRQSLVNAQTAWGDDLADWLVVLAKACDATSQNVVARKLNYGPGVISQVVNRRYAGSYPTVEKAVRGVLMAEKLDCPILGTIPTNDCLDHQKKVQAFVPSSSLRVQLYRACRGGCVHSNIWKAGEVTNA